MHFEMMKQNANTSHLTLTSNFFFMSDNALYRIYKSPTSQPHHYRPIHMIPCDSRIDKTKLIILLQKNVYKTGNKLRIVVSFFIID